MRIAVTYDDTEVYQHFGDTPYFNEYAQALEACGKPIEWLYCAGNVGGRFYGGADYPFHQTWLSLGRCYTFGMIAAKHALSAL